MSRTVRAVDSGAARFSASDSDVSEYAFLVETMNGAESTNKHGWYKKKLFATMKLGRPTMAVKFQLDSGATVNILPKQLYMKVFSDTNLEEMEATNTELRMYNGSQLKPIGSRAVKVTNPKTHRQYRMRFLIFDAQCQPLLGATAVQGMNLIKVQESNICQGPAVNDDVRYWAECNHCYKFTRDDLPTNTRMCLREQGNSLVPYTYILITVYHRCNSPLVRSR